MAVAVFVGGAVLGAAFGEVFAVLHDTVKNMGSKVLMFKSELKSLKSNLDLLAPVVDEISRLNRELGCPEEETKRLIEDMEKAEKLIHIISEKKGWTSDFQVYHSKQLTELDKAIVKFCQVHMPAQIRRDTLQIKRDTSQIKRDTSQISHNLEDTSQTLQMVLEEFKALREENKLKEKAQILITEGQCRKTISLEIHGHDVLIKGLASVSLMTSLSTQKIPSSSLFSYRRYNVFLSFIGKDTCMIADPLYVALERNGMVTFRDDNEFVKEPSIGSDCIKGIEESTVAIVLLSKSFASYHWCLSKLQKILSYHRETGMRILPIFYDVDPSDVRKQRGPFAEAFTRHEKYFTENKEWVETWRAVFTDVGSMSGWCLKERMQSKLIQMVVEDISKNIPMT